jgi:hypothetical protein
MGINIGLVGMGHHTHSKLWMEDTSFTSNSSSGSSSPTHVDNLSLLAGRQKNDCLLKEFFCSFETDVNCNLLLCVSNVTDFFCKDL